MYRLTTAIVNDLLQGNATRCLPVTVHSAAIKQRNGTDDANEIEAAKEFEAAHTRNDNGLRTEWLPFSNNANYNITAMVSRPPKLPFARVQSVSCLDSRTTRSKNACQS